MVDKSDDVAGGDDGYKLAVTLDKTPGPTSDLVSVNGECRAIKALPQNPRATTSARRHRDLLQDLGMPRVARRASQLSSTAHGSSVHRHRDGNRALRAMYYYSGQQTSSTSSKRAAMT